MVIALQVGNEFATRSDTSPVAPARRDSSVSSAYEDGVVVILNEGHGIVIRRERRSLIHTLIDEMFAEMATDQDYQRDARRLTDEFAVSDWESLHRSEHDD